MSGKKKCPDCGFDLDFQDYDPYDEPHAYHCEKCFFGCKISSLEKITAAMVFTKYFVKYKEARKILTENDYTPENDHYLVESTIAFNKAGEKVLEVFNE